MPLTECWLTAGLLCVRVCLRVPLMLLHAYVCIKLTGWEKHATDRRKANVRKLGFPQRKDTLSSNCQLFSGVFIYSFCSQYRTYVTTLMYTSLQFTRMFTYQSASNLNKQFLPRTRCTLFTQYHITQRNTYAQTCTITHPRLSCRLSWVSRFEVQKGTLHLWPHRGPSRLRSLQTRNTYIWDSAFWKRKTRDRWSKG